ncbi:hypothetical protein GCM10009664_43290 [Kitasatospora gansuensis]
MTNGAKAHITRKDNRRAQAAAPGADQVSGGSGLPAGACQTRPAKSGAQLATDSVFTPARGLAASTYLPPPM